MTSPVVFPHVDTLLSSAVVRWFASFGEPGNPSILTLDDIVYGDVLYEVVARLDQRLQLAIPAHIRHGRDNAELRLTALLEVVTNFYQNELHIIILMELPIINVILSDPSSESGVDNIRRFLLLIVGCAVQGEYQQKYIDDIMGLEASAQMEIMESIQSLMQAQLSTMWGALEDLPKDTLIDSCERAYQCLTQAVAERDAYAVKLASNMFPQNCTAPHTKLKTQHSACAENAQEYDQKDKGNSTMMIGIVEHQNILKTMQAKLTALSETVEAKELAIQDLVQVILSTDLR